jgi:hypothetical protein
MARSWGAVVTLVMLCCLFVFVASGAVPAGSGHETASDSLSSDSLSSESETGSDRRRSQRSSTAGLGAVEIDRTLFEFTVTRDGNASWLFEFQLQLNSDEEVNNFEDFAAFFRTNETELYKDFRSRAYSLVRSANASTDRDMTARSFSRDAYVDEQLGGDFGVLQIRFDWSNFARVSNTGVVRFGDFFQGQLFIDANQKLRLAAGDGLRFHSVRPSPDVTNRERIEESTRVTWDGQHEFADGRPNATLLPEDHEGFDDGNGDGNTEENAGVGSGTVIGGLFLLALVAASVVLWHRDQLPFADALPLPTEDSDDSTPPAPDQSPSTARSSEAPSEAPDADPDSRAISEATISDEELLSDEDRVLGMIEERGGRMKQVDIVDQTGWSKSKVSMLLSDMEEENEISKIRVGRENIIAIEGQEPDAAGSPFEDA